MENPLTLQFEKIIPAPLESVWQAWTTEAGVRTFFAPQCAIDLRPGGRYEMYFDLEAPPGSCGGEGCVMLAIEDQAMLSFTWNAPPELPSIRSQRTHVTVYFTSIDPAKTKVTLIHDGWGSNEDWQRARKYFMRAWGEVVLPRLEKRFIIGPIDWKTIQS